MSQKSDALIAVTSKSFSATPELRAKLLSRYAHVRFNDDGGKLEGDDLISFLAGCEKIILGTEGLHKLDLSVLPDLKLVSKYGVGLNNVDLQTLAQRNIRFAWQGGLNKRSVAELTICMAISLFRHVNWTNRQLQQGTWNKMTGALLSGKTVGVIGCGHIGKDLTMLLKHFGCEVLVHDIRDYSDFYASHGVHVVGKEALLQRSDVVTVHVPLNKTTENMISGPEFALMKPHAILINTARGGIVNEAALKTALKEKKIAGAGFDVFVEEPVEDKELIEMPQFIATPHIGGSAVESVLLMGYAAIDGLEDATNVQEFLANNPDVLIS
jgi:D-3-phosphoglycerate dehydrogenase